MGILRRATGTQIVKLKPSGSFSGYGPATFPITLDSNSHSFTIYVQDSAGKDMDYKTYVVTANGRHYHGPTEGGLDISCQL